MSELLRYVLFGSNESWDGTDKCFLLSSNDIQDVFDYAVLHGKKFSLVIDRHHPAVPIYLDRDNNYWPIVDKDKL